MPRTTHNYLSVQQQWIKRDSAWIAWTVFFSL